MNNFSKQVILGLLVGMGICIVMLNLDAPLEMASLLVVIVLISYVLSEV